MKIFYKHNQMVFKFKFLLCMSNERKYPIDLSIKYQAKSLCKER